MRIQRRLLSLSILLGRIYGDGFLPTTSILTPCGAVQLQDVQVGSRVLGFNDLSGTIEPCEVDSVFVLHDWPAIDLLISGRWLRCAANQMFLCSDGYWKTADLLEPGALLAKQDGEYDTVLAVEAAGMRDTFYGLSVTPHHTFCLAETGLIAHNLVFVVPVATYVIGEGLCLLGIAALGGAAYAAGSQLVQERVTYGRNTYEWSHLFGASGAVYRQTTKGSWRPSSYAGGGNSSPSFEPPEKKPPKKPQPEGGPHGLFEGSSKHGTQARRDISAAPKNGQAALDNSFPYSETSSNRVGYSEGQFVKLMEHSEGKFHGYEIPYAEVPDKIQKILKAAGIVTASGRFIL